MAQHAAAAVSNAASHAPGRVALVGAGPGDPEILTVRARELLADADVVLHDALVSDETLALCGPDTRIEPVGKRGGRESARQEAITARMIQLAGEGNLVVRLKGGDPFVFGRGGEELRDLVGAGIDVVVVPGVSAAVAAPSAAGIPLTMRGVSSSVAVTSAEGEASLARLRHLAAAADTLVVLMVYARLESVAAALAEVLRPSRPAALISNATLPEQRAVMGTLANIAHLARCSDLEAPATLVVGDVVQLAPANQVAVETRAGLG